jgi:hypothetical protein
MAQFALDLEKEKTSFTIKCGASVAITIAGILSMFMMNDAFPDVIATGWRILINIPSLILFAIAIYVLVAPDHVEW